MFLKLMASVQKLKNILLDQLSMEPLIENAHRLGTVRDNGTPRPIMCKFSYRPERFQVVKRKRELNNVWITEDLIQEDRQRKSELKAILKEPAFEAGKNHDFDVASFTSMVSCTISNTIVLFIHGLNLVLLKRRHIFSWKGKHYLLF